MIAISRVINLRIQGLIRKPQITFHYYLSGQCSGDSELCPAAINATAKRLGPVLLPKQLIQ